MTPNPDVLAHLVERWLCVCLGAKLTDDGDLDWSCVSHRTREFAETCCDLIPDALERRAALLTPRTKCCDAHRFVAKLISRADVMETLEGVAVEIFDELGLPAPPPSPTWMH